MNVNEFWNGSWTNYPVSNTIGIVMLLSSAAAAILNYIDSPWSSRLLLVWMVLFVVHLVAFGFEWHICDANHRALLKAQNDEHTEKVRMFLESWNSNKGGGDGEC